MIKKRVLISGGGGDIAKEIKNILQCQGYDVYAPTRQQMDVTEVESIERAMRDFNPDVLINNAGYVSPKSVKDADFALSKEVLTCDLMTMVIANLSSPLRTRHSCNSGTTTGSS